MEPGSGSELDELKTAPGVKSLIGRAAYKVA